MGASPSRDDVARISAVEEHILLSPINCPVNRFCDDFAWTLTDEHGGRQFVPPDLENDEIHGYIIGREIGVGAEATVYEGFRSSVFPYAIKRYKQGKGLESDTPREIAIANALNHPHCTRIIDHFVHDGTHYVVMPMANAGALTISQGPEITTTGAVLFLWQIGSALAHMHSLNIVHRDIKPGNILLFDDGYSLCDYSISAQLSRSDEQVSGISGTSVFMAPEIGISSYAPKPVDIWAVGVTIYGLLFGKLPWTLSRILEGNVLQPGLNAAKNQSMGELQFPESPAVPSELKDVIRHMLVRDPASRITAKDIAEHPWIDDKIAEWQRLTSFMEAAE